jgi:hypothetical protein
MGEISPRKWVKFAVIYIINISINMNIHINIIDPNLILTHAGLKLEVEKKKLYENYTAVK